MDILSAAIEVAGCVRVIIGAYKGESNVIIAARQLMRSCQLYEDCLTTLLASLREQSKAASYVGSSVATAEFQQGIQSICLQVKGDKTLLDEILEQAKSIASSTKSQGYSMNVLTSLLTGRVSKIKELEGALMTRVSLVTALMMKSVFKAAQGLDAAAIESINDVDGSIFWQAHFGVSRQVTFQRFFEAYQQYLTNTFVFRRLRKQQLMVLLGNTLLDRQTAELSSPSMSTSVALLNMEVSVDTFALWLRRYGPMKDTLIKCAAVTLPSTGRCVTWFRPWMSRDEASQAIERQMRAPVVSPADLLIVRYSADPKVSFVITTRPPGFTTVEHYPITNSGEGYRVSGDTRTAPTLLDCIQMHIFDRLFVQQGSGTGVDLSRQPIDEWNKVFSDVTVELPADHYRSGKELDAAMKNVSLLPVGKAGEDEDWGSALTAPESEGQFTSLFAVGAVTSGAEYAAEQAAGDPSALPVAVATTCSVPLNEAAVVGNYMIKHGVSVLRSANKMSAEDAAVVLAIMKKYE